jgi:hypothetical protein
MVIGAGPQENVITPPAATAVTTACDVQLPGVPLPMTLVGFEMSSALASAGIAAFPAGLPNWAGGATGAGGGGGGAAEAAVEAEVVAETGAEEAVGGSKGGATLTPGVLVAHPASNANEAKAANRRRMAETLTPRSQFANETAYRSSSAKPAG